MSKVRIGIDVGGTYTDAVAIDNDTYEVVGKIKVPTTHTKGVAVGIVEVLNKLMEEIGVKPEDVVFISHGTTQATNALLEGDVAKVGILGVSTGVDKRNAKNDSELGDIELAKNRYLHTTSSFIDSKELDGESVTNQLKVLKNQGAEVIVASETYSIEDPTNEIAIIEQANKLDMLGTGGHEISELYGFKVRTRTAVINASLIPKMLETADMTEESIKKAGITTPLMIMRCDGGVMNVEEVRKRPILTMLSGLAAGVAGALMYEKISDGIFFEVGGTSVDISVIKNGSVMIKNAEVGGHKTYVQSLDVRTLAIAGGSMVVIENNRVSDVGPRSAHIANKPYECFADDERMKDLSVEYITPKKDEITKYAVVQNGEGEQFAYTLAGAANFLGYVPSDDYAYGNQLANNLAWERLGKELGQTADEVASAVLNIALEKVWSTVRDLMNEYDLTNNFTTLVGGGGSGAIIVPALGEKYEMTHKIANNAPYISTIGVALAMVREQLERSIINPTEDDIRQIRADIMEKIVKAGANEETVEISIEIDAQKNILRAIASGTTELRTKDLSEKEMPVEKMKVVVNDALGGNGIVTEKAASQRWHVFEKREETRKFFGLIKSHKNALAVLDREGIVRLKKENAFVTDFSKKDWSEFDSFIEEHTIYSDANATPPKAYLFFKEKMLDLTGLQSKEQILSISELELESVKDDQKIIAICYK